MIFYFSATGNSKYAAVRLADEFGGKLINIPDAMRHNEYEYSIEDGEKAFFVFPVYFYGLPDIVSDFIAKISFTGGVPDVCGLCTCGSSPGGADHMFKDQFKKKGIEPKAFYKVKMVDNYILLFKIPLIEEQIMILRRSDKEINGVIDSIKFNYRVSYKSGILMKLASKVTYSFYKGKCSTQKFSVSDSCIGCGLCQTICPVSAIQMEDGRPVWTKEQCLHCLGCMNRCPAEAIQYGKRTENKGRYVNPILK